MKSWMLLLAFVMALALSNLVVLAREAEAEAESRDVKELWDDDDDDDDKFAKGSIHKAAERVCRLFSEHDDNTRDLLQIQKRSWLSRTWKKIKDTAKEVWDVAKPVVIPAIINSVGKRGQLDDASLELNAEEKRALEEFVRAVDDDESLQNLIRKRGWIKDTWNKVKDGVKNVVDKIEDAVKPHIPWLPGKRGHLAENKELDEETRRALEEFSLAPRAQQIVKRGKFWDRVKKVWKNVIKPALKKVLTKRDGNDTAECDSELTDIRDSLDVLYTVTEMAGDVEGCEVDDDGDDDDDDTVDDDDNVVDDK